MDGEVRHEEQVISFHRLSPAHCLVVADSQVVYEGTDESEISAAFFRAGNGGARSVACFVNGVRVTYSRAV